MSLSGISSPREFLVSYSADIHAEIRRKNQYRALPLRWRAGYLIEILDLAMTGSILDETRVMASF